MQLLSIMAPQSAARAAASRTLYDTSTAGNATLIANGGTGGGLGGAIFFQDNSTGGTSRVEVFGNGNLDISFHKLLQFPGVAIGSIEGDGNVFLGANNLTMGSNNLSTTFSGVIQDGGQNSGTGGSLTKIGTGTLAYGSQHLHRQHEYQRRRVAGRWFDYKQHVCQPRRYTRRDRNGYWECYQQPRARSAREMHQAR